MTETIQGSCLCGAIVFAVSLPFEHFYHCHCSRCRKATGAAHATNAIVKPAAFHWIKGEECLSHFELPTARSFGTAFCRHCGAPMPHFTRSGREVIIPAGAFDADPMCKPDRHMQWASRAPWYEHGNDLPIEN
jgi:hypothetical protein